MGQRGATKTMTYGYHRLETVGALLNVLLILVLALVLVYCAIQRIIHPPESIDTPVMLGTAIFGLCCNVLMAYILMRKEAAEEAEEEEERKNALGSKKDKVA